MKLHMEWSGNYLEVNNVMERLVVQSGSNVITVDDLPVEYRKQDSELNSLAFEGGSLTKILENVEKRVLTRAVHASNIKQRQKWPRH
ncbi:AAA-type ATPase lid domain-containing protein [Salinibacillus xinjiangensis]|uniref:NorR-like AAA+ ATPase lid domain-containing protein n=1 Tax=Salinibacillus xinjiangensis TaxID=1229268 RepID=A0A6G1X225_9BACI|nr:hypothetical protein [Salinibacillus xinjiangensis]MRG84992.1 hypothetical protein [Salinibacillus xinjiangensis]